MATYYLKPGAGGTDSGTQANPFLSLQSALNGVTGGGDIVYCNGSETLSSTPVVAVSGAASNYINFIATDASWNRVAGTYYTVDGNSVATNCLNYGSYNSYKWVGFKFTGATGHGVSGGGSLYTDYLDCWMYSNGGYGIEMGSYNNLIECRVYNNTSYGVLGSSANYLQSCSLYGNGVMGFRALDFNTMIHCLVYNNSNNNVYLDDYNVIYGMINDDAGIAGIRFTGTFNMVSDSIISNSAGWGITFSTADCMGNSVAFYNNTSGTVDTPASYRTIKDDIILASDPYADQSTNDYTLSADNSTLVNLARTLDSNGNTNYATIGIPPQYVAGTGGGRQPRARIHGV